VYLAMPERAASVLRVAEPLLGIFALPGVRKAAGMLIDRAGLGPKADARRSGRAHLWGRVKDDAGHEASATLDTAEGYSLTAQTAVEIAERVTAGKVAAGAHTPSQAFGPRFIEEFAGSMLVVTGSR
jgi:short subunit dehydrogenase-like uncharacterized protein